MATVTETQKPEKYISQGDIFENVKYIYSFNEKESYVDIKEITFPHIIVLSQACDMRGMYEFRENNATKTKLMMSVLVAPFFEKRLMQDGKHLEPFEEHRFDKAYNSNEYKIINKDYHYRFHRLDFEEEKNKYGFPESVIDFKLYFTLDINYLYENLEKRITTLKPIYKEQVTRKFANYLSRVAIP